MSHPTLLVTTFTLKKRRRLVDQEKMYSRIDGGEDDAVDDATYQKMYTRNENYARERAIAL